MCEVLKLDDYRKAPRKRTRAEQAAADYNAVHDCGQAMLDYANALRGSHADLTDDAFSS